MLIVQDLTRKSDDGSGGWLLEAINFELDFGHCAVISGASGSGKTLLLRALIDLDPNSGAVQLGDDQRDHLDVTQWRHLLCYVPAEPGWWAVRAKDHFDNLEKAHGLAASVGLAEKLFDEPVSQLSTGERQRFALVRGLCGSPKGLLLDEPTAALDPQSTALVEQVLRRYLEAGNVLVLVTHDRAQGERMGNAFYVMTEGRLVNQGPKP